MQLNRPRTCGLATRRAGAAAFSSPRPSLNRCRAAIVTCEAASIQFIKGVDEPTIPEVKLSRSRSGASGTAMFIFENPSIFQASGEMGEITGLFMTDEEGTLTTTDVKAKFVNGKPQAIEAKYMMRSGFEWDRFIRFMDRYSEAKGLGFEKGNK